LADTVEEDAEDDTGEEDSRAGLTLGLEDLRGLEEDAWAGLLKEEKESKGYESNGGVLPRVETGAGTPTCTKVSEPLSL